MVLHRDIQGGEDVLIQDQPLTEVIFEVESPIKGDTDYVGYQLTAIAATPLLGYTAQGGIGIIGQDGVFLNAGIGAALGWDFSISFTTVTGKYKGSGKPSAQSLKGLATSGNVGVGAFTAGYGEDITTTKEGDKIKEYSGQNWSLYSRGLSIGSKTFLGGNISTISTTSPGYIYKK